MNSNTNHQPPTQSYKGFWVAVVLAVGVAAVVYVKRLPDGSRSYVYEDTRDDKQRRIDALQDRVYFLERDLRRCKGRLSDLE